MVLKSHAFPSLLFNFLFLTFHRETRFVHHGLALSIHIVTVEMQHYIKYLSELSHISKIRHR